MASTFRLGVDIGGTFTDAVLVDEQTGAITVLKVPSSRSEPWRPVLTALSRLTTDLNIVPSAIRYFVHGTTLATNTVIERNGARTGLLVTEGFRDILEIGRQRLTDVLNLQAEAPHPLVDRSHVIEIPERILSDGRVDLPLDEAAVAAGIKALADDDIQAAAICFLHAYRYPQHERAAGEVAQRTTDGIHLALSSEVWPELREYERAVITIIDAYVGPRMAGYFSALEANLRDEDFRAPILISRSNGGIMSAKAAGLSPAQTLLSGPAAGVMGAAHVAQLAGYPKIITFDMGGTSADIAVIDGDPLLSTESRVGDFPVIMPAVDVTSIGAGGGSIAWRDLGGVLKVGPRSAGSEPGPACLGRGGTEPAVTDAYLQLGVIHPDRFVGGEIKLDPEASRQALTRLGGQFGLSARDAADAIMSVATANMYADFIPLAAKKGVEISDFSLLAYGGAGPTHACLFAEETGIKRVIIPASPGTLCALGALIMDVKTDYVRTLYMPLAALVGDVMVNAYAELERDARTWLSNEAIPVESVEIRRTADMRYVGQGFDINIAIPVREDGSYDWDALAEAFHRRHQLLYRHSDPNAPIEVTTARLTLVGATPAPPEMRADRNGHEPLADGSRSTETRAVYHRGRELQCAVYSRTALRAGDRLDGPCIVEQYDTTTYVTPGFAGLVDAHGNLILEAR